MSEHEFIISERLREVWSWKDQIYREVEGLPIEEAIDKILENAHQTAKKYGYNKTISPTTKFH